MEEAFKSSGYNGKDGTFADAAGRANFEQLLKGGAAAAGAVPLDAITKNGGMNDVAISMVNNMSFEQLTQMVEGGKNDQAAALLDVAQKLAGASTSAEAMSAFEVANPGLTMNTDELKAAMTNAAKLTADASEKGIMKQAAEWAKINEKADRNEAKMQAAADRLAREGEKLEKKLLGKKKGRRG